MGQNLVLPDRLLDDKKREILREAARECHVSGDVSPLALTALREAGVLAISVPREYGGLGYTPREVNAVVEDIAAVNPSMAIVAYLHCAVAARLDAYGTEDQKQRWFARIVEQQWLAASAWSEVGSSADKRSLSTIATPQPDGGYRLTGGKTFSTGATVADFFIVLAQLPAQTQATTAETSGYGRSNQLIVLVPRENEGVEVPAQALPMGGMRGSGTGMVRFTEVRVSPADVLCAGELTPQVIQLPHRLGLTLGAVSVGTARAARDILTTHLREKGLADDLESKRQLARLSLEIRAASAMVGALGDGAPHEAADFAYSVKVFASSTGQAVCSAVRGSLGSAGYMQHHPINQVALDADAIPHMGPPNHLCIDLIANCL
ncbi:acyl-CoA dehydrogenase family protein [Couchioplanes caeruleus]|uniref:Alkylation response protein AidB-like acyl-CoA dehydrogenase n=1 Tax=Couchioplanes caeruleus TaxID=56438 RepID=A0A3N1GM60_9ACTN|nr:acyl-CoA dehydrogenase family protein [Couchioplanes caeruleus]ROP31347.1 alkylation response protein AidB-like acyl-CoA dehydrogenase [Couchioplanes caeruleus]